MCRKVSLNGKHVKKSIYRRVVLNGTMELCEQTQPSNTVVAVFKNVRALLWKFHGEPKLSI